jgi:hypothetical protein
MTTTRVLFGILSLLTASPAFAAPWVKTTYRCTFDQLDAYRARGRFDWANKYALANPYNRNGSGGRLPRDSYFITTANALTAQDTYDAGTTAVYPVYVDPTVMPEPAPWVGPGGAGTSTVSVPWDQLVNQPHTLKPIHIQNDGLCEAGCYTPNQKLLFETGEVQIALAQSTGRIDLMTLSPNASLAKLETIKNTVALYTMDREPAQQLILTFQMQSGGTLSVTKEHPLITREGTVKRARLFSPGEFLLRKDGTPDEISNIEEHSWRGRTYNLKPITLDLTSNIVIAQGYLNGSGRYQSEFVDELNRLILRTNVPDEIIP